MAPSVKVPSVTAGKHGSQCDDDTVHGEKAVAPSVMMVQSVMVGKHSSQCNGTDSCSGVVAIGGI